MAMLLHRWRAPLLGGIAVWLLSFPLLTSRPAPVLMPLSAHSAVTVGVEADLHGLLQEIARCDRPADGPGPFRGLLAARKIGKSLPPVRAHVL